MTQDKRDEPKGLSAKEYQSLELLARAIKPYGRRGMTQGESIMDCSSSMARKLINKALATISAQAGEIEGLRAQVAVLVDECKLVVDESKRASRQFTAMSHAPIKRLGASISNLPAAAQAYMDEVAELKVRCEGHRLDAAQWSREYETEKNRATKAESGLEAAKVRTPGTVEVCSRCRSSSQQAWTACAESNEDWETKCPIRAGAEKGDVSLCKPTV